jgi:hypothetical protein
MREIEGSGSTSPRSFASNSAAGSFLLRMLTEQTDNPLSERLVAGYASF